jgi:hypothetical protein
MWVVLHGHQTFGGIHGKQWEYCSDNAAGSPRQEEFPFALGPRYQGPTDSNSNKANAPNSPHSVSKLLISR